MQKTLLVAALARKIASADLRGAGVAAVRKACCTWVATHV